jgi:hypothetical protein
LRHSLVIVFGTMHGLYGIKDERKSSGYRYRT